MSGQNQGWETLEQERVHQSPHPTRLLSDIISSYRKEGYFFCLKENYCYNYCIYMVHSGLELRCEKCRGKKVEEAFLILSLSGIFRQPVFILTSQRGQLPAACILSMFSEIDWLEVYDFNPHFAHSVTSRKEGAACCTSISK